MLGLTQTCFEGSMYLFVFLWVPSLQESAASSTLPLGYIFSSFMIAMMLGSLLYTTIVSYNASHGGDDALSLHAKLSSLVCAVSAFTFAVSVSSHDEHVRFWAFCAFEACVGMYYPVQGMLRGSLISNEHRATVRNLTHEKCSMIDGRSCAALFTIPSSSQHLRGGFPANWSILGTAYGAYSQCVHAWVFVSHDWCSHREAFGCRPKRTQSASPRGIIINPQDKHLYSTHGLPYPYPLK